PFSPSDEEMCFPKKRANSSPFPPPSSGPSTEPPPMTRSTIIKCEKPASRVLKWDEKMVEAFASFAIRFFVIASHADVNFICSPFSVALSLAVLHEGAEGSTKKELARVLGDGLASTDILNFYAHLVEMTSRTGLEIANGAFIDKKFEVRTEFLETVQSTFNAMPHTIDFRDGPAAAKLVNQFVCECTKGKIGEIMQSGSFETADLIMINAIHFKGFWSCPFKRSMTQEGLFRGVHGDRTVKFMNDTRVVEYSLSKELVVVQLGYRMKNRVRR
ncbi:hypothetical protein PMAYCL1PPCAC_01667, partial [Pristionchus mayeri]